MFSFQDIYEDRIPSKFWQRDHGDQHVWALVLSWKKSTWEPRFTPPYIVWWQVRVKNIPCLSVCRLYIKLNKGYSGFPSRNLKLWPLENYKIKTCASLSFVPRYLDLYERRFWSLQSNKLKSSEHLVLYSTEWESSQASCRTLDLLMKQCLLFKYSQNLQVHGKSWVYNLGYDALPFRESSSLETGIERLTTLLK